LVIYNTGFIITGINSRDNEYRADKFAYELGYGEGLISALYKLDKLTLMEGKRDTVEKIKASHPKIPFRIERLENMNLE
jgi:heat shock protein HtpX